MIVVIEGIDGVGKGTQSQRLLSRLKQEGLNCLFLSFPVYTSFFGQMIGEYLNGIYGSIDEVNPKLSSLLYALDRWQKMQDVNISSYDVVLIDRFVSSNLAHQAAKVDIGDKEDLLNWIVQLEYEVLCTPSPDLVVLLDADLELASAQVLTKKARAYTNKSKDLHESNLPYLKKVRDVFRKIASERPNYSVVECDKNGKMRSIADIHEEIWRIVFQKISQHRNKRQN